MTKEYKNQQENKKIVIEKDFIMVFTLIKKKNLAFFSLTLVAIILLSILLGFTGSAGVFYAKPVRRLPIYYVQTSKKQVAISFDCAWGVDYTDKLLEEMAKQDVKCTFFMVEFWAKKHPDYVKKIFDAGHEIGTHSATHPYMSKLSRDTIVKELSSSCKAIQEVTGKTPTVFRPPYGDYNDLLIQTAEELGLYTIQWDVDSLDWKDLTATQITERVLKRVKNGSIVLFHNQGLHTAEAIPTIIKSLKDNGYQFLPIGEMIYKENYQMMPDGGQKSNS